jgi:hypothetical protein
MALSSTLSTIRPSSGWLPRTQAPPGPLLCWTVRFRAAMAPDRAASAADTA